MYTIRACTPFVVNLCKTSRVTWLPVEWVCGANILCCLRNPHVLAVCLHEYTTVMILCKLCPSCVQPKHPIALFNGKGLKNKWSDCIVDFLCVPVHASDNFPQQICRSCKDRAESLEKQLMSLKHLAHGSYERLSRELTRTRKWAKDTRSAQCVLSATARACILQGKQLFFSSASSEETWGEQWIFEYRDNM